MRPGLRALALASFAALVVAGSACGGRETPDDQGFHQDVVNGSSGAEVTFDASVLSDPVESGAHERFQVRAGGGPRNRDEVDVLASELFEQHEITRVFYQHRIAGSKQDASQEVEGLGGAESRDDVGGPGGNAVLHQARGDLLA